MFADLFINHIYEPLDNLPNCNLFKYKLHCSGYFDICKNAKNAAILEFDYCEFSYDERSVIKNKYLGHKL